MDRTEMENMGREFARMLWLSPAASEDKYMSEDAMWGDVALGFAAGKGWSFADAKEFSDNWYDLMPLEDEDADSE